MTDWFTADLHLGHGNIIKHCNRPFLTDEDRRNIARDPKYRLPDTTVARHDEAMIADVNDRVKENDKLWVIGDLFWKRTPWVPFKCKNIRLVIGNHDKFIPHNIQTYEQILIDVCGQKIFLNHFPMRAWDRSFHGSWHIHGHVHGKYERFYRDNPYILAMDVGVDVRKPVCFEEILQYMKPRMEAFRNHPKDEIA